MSRSGPHKDRPARSQEDRILWLLRVSYPNWAPAPSLAEISLQYSPRIFSLRRKGWQIENRVETKDGVKRGFFRLATPETWPNPKRSTERKPAESNSSQGGTRATRTATATFPEFGQITRDRSYAE